MSLIDNKAVFDLHAGLTTFLANSAKYADEQGAHPKENSQADKEQTTGPREESIITVYGASNLLIESAGEHLSAFLKTIIQPIEVLACWTCVRAIQEACALSAWLCDPTIQPLERIGRTFAWRYEGLEQQLKFGRAAKVNQTEIDTAKKRIEELEKIALGLGFQKFRNSKDERIAIAQHMPKITNLIRDVLDHEAYYRLLSAIAHGHHWAHLQLGYVRHDDQANTEIGNISTVRLEKTVKPEYIVILGSVALKAIARAMWNKSLYFGWEMNPLEEVIDNAADAIR